MCGKTCIGMHLAGVIDNVGKDRHDLAEMSGFLQECFVQAAHLRPEADACHGELALEALLQVFIQAGILLFVQLEFLRDV